MYIVVYLRTDPAECYERIKKRSRVEETGIPMVLKNTPICYPTKLVILLISMAFPDELFLCFPQSLITSIHQHHEDWLINKTKFEIPAPVLVRLELLKSKTYISCLIPFSLWYFQVLDGNKELKDMFKIYETNTKSILLGMGDEPVTC